MMIISKQRRRGVGEKQCARQTRGWKLHQDGAAPAPADIRDGKIVHLGIPERKAGAVLCHQHCIFRAELGRASDPLLRVQLCGAVVSGASALRTRNVLYHSPGSSGRYISRQ